MVEDMIVPRRICWDLNFRSENQDPRYAGLKESSVWEVLAPDKYTEGRRIKTLERVVLTIKMVYWTR